MRKTKLTPLLPIGLFLLLAGCANEPIRFYTLDPPPVETPLANLPEITLGIGPIRLPATLDRPGIITRVGANRVEVLAFDQWAGSLKDEFLSLVADQLGSRLGTQRIAIYPWTGDSVDIQVLVEVLELEGALGGEAHLTASWTLLNAKSREVLRLEKSSHKTHVDGAAMSEVPPKDGKGIAELVAAYSRLAAQLAEEIAQEIARENAPSA